MTLRFPRGLVRSLFLAALFIGTTTGCLVTEKTPGRAPEATFEEAFPEPAALLTTNAPEQVGLKLIRTVIPDTQEHRETIDGLLESVETIDTDHLLLLSWAMASAFEDVPRGTYLVINNMRIEKTRVRRGEGVAAGAVDALLLRGLAKVSDLDAANAGRLLGRTETPGGLVTMTDRLLSHVDDGSTKALTAILDGFNRSFPKSKRSTIGALILGGSVATAKEQFVDLLFERGLAEGERERVALASFRSDSDRADRIIARLAELDRVSASQVRGYLELLEFSSTRAEVLVSASPLIGDLDGATLRELVATLDYDSQRLEALQALLASSTERMTSEELLATMRLLSYGSSRMDLVRAASPRVRWSRGEELVSLLGAFGYGTQRLEMLDVLLPAGPSPRSWDLAVPVLSQFDYVSERMSALDLLRPGMDRAIDPGTFRSLFELVNYDSERLGLLRSFSSDVRAFPETERRSLVRKFAYPSTRQKAEKILSISRG